jgi:N-acyl-D-amino-acid deacylase
MFDHVIKGVTIIDGTGAPAYLADVGVSDGRIAAIGDLSAAESASVIDGTGKTLCPGFIDMHSHTDLEFFKDKAPDAKVRQGVTTELLGQDGLGTAPISAADRPLMAGLVAGLLGKWPEGQWQWESFAEYLAALKGRGLPNNVAVLASHGPLRIAAMGMADKLAGREEIRKTQRELEVCLEDGAAGFSTGLIYPPCSYCDTEELIELNRVMASHGGPFVVHQRDEGFGLTHSFAEVSHIAKSAGVPLHVSHLQAYGQRNWPLMESVLTEADRLLAEGVTVTWDRYPYLAGSTVLTAVLPAWTLSQGTAALIKNLKDPAYRNLVKAEYSKGLDVWHNRSISVGWGKVVVSAVTLTHNKWMEGKSCQEIADTLGLDPVDFIMDILAEESLAVTMISHYGSEEVLARVLGHPQATVGSDGIFGGRPHPRLYGTFPRFLRRFAMDNGTLTPESAVRKITGFPAEILGLKKRGLIRQGYHADLVLLNWSTLKDNATYEEPHQYSSGVEYVFVNGVPVVNAGVAGSELPGQVLKRG